MTDNERLLGLDMKNYPLLKYLYRRSATISETRQPVALDTQMYIFIFSIIRYTNVPIPVDKKISKIHFIVDTTNPSPILSYF